MKKKLISILLIMAIIFTTNIYGSSSTSAAVIYSPTAALKYAKQHWDDGVGLCAEFVSKCLSAGGVSVSDTTVKGLRQSLLDGEYAQFKKLKTVKSSSGNLMVNISDNEGKVKKGDVIFWYCPKCGKWSHVEICGGFDDEGYMTIYAHNRAYNNKRMYVDRHCSGTDMYVYCASMKTSELITIKYYDEDGGEVVGTSYFAYGYSTKRLTLSDLDLSKKGYTFAGWKAYRTCDKKWLGYLNGSSKKGWYTSSQIKAADSFEYYLYSESGSNSTTAKSGTLKLYAQWTANTITVKYYDEMGGSKVGTSEYTYGGTDKRLSSTELGLAKDGYSCTGFYVYRSYDKKWKGYLNGSSSAGWYTSTQIKTAGSFEYYLYSDKSQKISTLSPEGTVKFYAVWESLTDGHEYNKILTKKASTEKNGIYTYRCIYCRDEYTKEIAKIESVKLEYSSVVYCGSELKPSVTVTDANGKIISSKYYKVKYISNKNPGIAKVKVTFSGKYTGTVTKEFTITPKKVKSVSVTNVSGRKLYIKWKEASESISGYKVQYATDADFTENKSTKTVKSSKNTYTTSALKKGKTYYIRIRAYKKTSDGDVIYGKWSDVKKIKISK